jgi:hypothetical protein
MIESTSLGPAIGRVDDTRFAVCTSALDATCTELERAVRHGRDLLDHPGVLRGRAEDVGDDDLRAAVVHFAGRWHWGLQVLVDDASRLLTDLRSAARLYDELERTTVTTREHPAGWVR